MIRLYQNYSPKLGESVQLDETRSHYLTHVLRAKINQEVEIFNGSNQVFLSTIDKITKKAVIVKILKIISIDVESPLKIHLYQGVSKFKRMDLVMQKAVELGVYKITPLITQHNAVKLNSNIMQKKLEHWRQIIISACEQSGRNVVPELGEFQDFSAELLNQENLNLMLHLNATNTLQELDKPRGMINLFIGPEGGFSEEEAKLFVNASGEIIKFGPRILRTETASIAAIAALQCYFGDLGL